MAAEKRALRVGRTPSASGGDSQFWSLKDGDVATITMLAELDEIVSVDQFSIWDFNPAAVWVDSGSGDPGYELGLTPGYRAFIPISVVIDGTEEVKVWSVGIGLHRTISEVAQMTGTLKGLICRAKRTGSGLKTKYVLISTGKMAIKLPKNIPSSDDIIATLGPDTREGIIKLIEDRSGSSFATLLKNAGKASGTVAELETEVEEIPF